MRTQPRVYRRALVAAIALCLTSCAPQDDQSTGFPELTLSQSTRLSESDSLFVGRPLGFAVGVDSLRFVVTDLSAGRVLAWNDTGRIVASFGREGRGPGEFLGPAAVALQRDLLRVADYGSMTWRALRSDDATEVARVAFTGDLTYATQSLFSDTLLFGLWDEVSGTAVGLLVPRDSAILRAVPVPSEFARLKDIGIGRLAQMLPAVSGPWRVVGFGPLNGLYVLDEGLTVTDSVVLPVVRRRGMTEERLRTAQGGYAALMNSVSVLSLLRAMERPGHFLAVHYDLHAVDDDAPQLTATLYVSVIDIEKRRVCADALVPQSGAARPSVQVSGDTLFILRQEMEETRIATFIDQYVVSAAACQWTPLVTGPMLTRRD
jgi:hypothetical protein